MRGLAIILLLLPLAASATTIAVNTNADNTNGGDGHCTLREAIANVNAAGETTGGDCPPGSGSGDTIVFSASYAIRLTLGELQIQQDVSIVGPPAALQLGGAHRTRVFEIVAGTTSMSDVTIRDGKADRGAGILVDSGATLSMTNCTIGGNTATVNGGGLFNNGGTVTLSTCTFNGNQARPGNGGGLYNGAGSAALTNCIFTANVAHPGNGGAIDNEATAMLTNCTFKRNHARVSSGGALENGGMAMVTGCTFSLNKAAVRGGGIDSGGTLTISNSTLSGNTASVAGGGIENGGTSTLTNSTISGNDARLFVVGVDGGGGGMDNNGTASLTNCTLTGNHAARDGGGINNHGTITAHPTIEFTNCTLFGNKAPRGGGGGVAGPATYSNTIVANNIAKFGANCDGESGGFDSGHNLVSTGNNTCLSTDGTDLLDTNPMLAPLGTYGGPTQTLALCTGIALPHPSCTGPSPAIDAGDDAVTGPPDNLATDQRGLPRLSGAHVDIGAYEVQ